MKRYRIESDIEKVPNILGLKASFFFIFVGILLLSAIPLVNAFSLGLFVFLLFFNAVGYLILFWRSSSFIQNKLGDEKMPDYIDNNPE